jgi:hypothetical protein
MPSVRYTLAQFMNAQPDEVLGRVAARYAEMGFSSLHTAAIDAWNQQVPILQNAFRELVAHRPEALRWSLLLEYELPMRDRRPDAVILAGNSVFVIEFKVGAESFDSAALWQVQSYALDLRDFHPGCRDRAIVPILVATGAPDPGSSERALVTHLRRASVPVQQANASRFGACLVRCADVYCSHEAPAVEPIGWESAVYSPTPSIIEAAQSLFGGHRVEEISHAFSDTLQTTSRRIVRAIEDARGENRRTICFVTGIPGSGKTLVGLNAVHSPALLNNNQSCAVFLSGNGPLVKVIREALTREKVRVGVRASEAKDVASAFISNVHRFLKNFGIEHPDQVPAQNAIIFDEAQRAWSAGAVEREHKVLRSEPAMVLDIMERVPGWATVVALVGGGQEINTGEAGLAEWGRALSERDTSWTVLASPEALAGGESVAGNQLFAEGVPGNAHVMESPELHLNISVRSHRAEFIGEWVNRTLSDASLVDPAGWTTHDFPVVLTRDLTRAREWLNERKEEHQRTGLLASSGAVRLRAFGLELSGAFRKGISYPDWFLNAEGDVRSSFQLEVAASEFDCQGLEIDWAGVCWGGDYVVDPGSGLWDCLQFRGNNWVRIRDTMKRQYTLNKYRVLLTRARRGMVIWVPVGGAAAHNTRALDATANRLLLAGIKSID